MCHCGEGKGWSQYHRKALLKVKNHYITMERELYGPMIINKERVTLKDNLFCLLNISLQLTFIKKNYKAPLAPWLHHVEVV